MKKLLVMMLALVFVFACFAGCNGGLQKLEPSEKSYIELDDYKAYVKADLAKVLAYMGNGLSAEVSAEVNSRYSLGLKAVEACTSVEEVAEAFSATKKAMADCVPYANGMFDFTALSAEERTEILGILEDYAVRNGLTGTTLFENGGYVMFNERITLGTETYIPGYGFGTLAEGDITADLATENNPDWVRYYHTIEASDPGNANYLNDQGSQVGDFYGYIGASYYTLFMNETKDGYVWTPELAVGEPVALDKDYETKGVSASWKMEVRSDLKYSTLGSRSKYNNRSIALEDYITPYKLLLNQANNYYRGGEMANATGAATFKGAKDYYNATSEQRKGILSDSEQSFSTVGIKAYEEDGKWYLEFTLGAPVTAYYAKYYSSSSLYMPIPAEFIEEVGVETYLGFSTDNTSSPVDNSLSLGAYVFERWDSEQQVVYKKNPNYVLASEKYKIQGIHINILKAAATDKEAGIKEFLAGKTDSTGIPDTYLETYVSDPRTRTTTGDSCFKLNMNALDQATWELYFGEDGTINQSVKEEYWECEPAMSNAHFRAGLSYALNRVEFSAIKGNVASVNFFSSNYMSDPENGMAYNLTKAHKDAVAQLLAGTDEGGYSLELARDYFRMAIEELEASGAYEPGTPENPTVIEIEVAWIYPQHEESYHKYVKQYWETAFNDESVTGGKYKLDVVFWVGNEWSDVYYNKLMIGCYDVGFGSISGNSLNPLGFMSVLSSDPVISGSFTLNWGVNTNDPDVDPLVYNGMRWSYDALYKAANEGVVIANGANVTLVEATDQDMVAGEESATITLEIGYESSLITLDLESFDFKLFGYYGKDDYHEWSVAKYLEDTKVDAANGTVTFTFVIPNSEFSKFDPTAGDQGIDIYWAYSINGTDISYNDFGATYYFEFVSASNE